MNHTKCNLNSFCATCSEFKLEAYYKCRWTLLYKLANLSKSFYLNFLGLQGPSEGSEARGWHILWLPMH
jgi:hypothetical protein